MQQLVFNEASEADNFSFRLTHTDNAQERSHRAWVGNVSDMAGDTAYFLRLNIPEEQNGRKLAYNQRLKLVICEMNLERLMKSREREG